ncbi:Ribose 1,5-bisphosphate isomerase [Candidatus Lokiarchaeum ossiferum]|uniref:Ribose 1,5-bisphosphate isomerase n=1 Tax=Candidatus Lokiarchaeum ossiferum TaxID=2951803 RepID=A0ABY6HXR0_9ARCH|nr:Ribose 1,5-bisphosphate isomerase [Candidatus Lokiarchaeum sp. B-35]
MKELKKAASKIRALEVQGATNIALFAVNQMVQFAQRNAHLSKPDLWNYLVKAEEIFAKSRSTEPAMRNGLMYILGKLRHDYEQGIDYDMAKMVEIYGSEYEKILKVAKRRIAKYGARLIPDNLDEPYVVQTHCHSSIVEAILIEAHRQGKNFKVISTETRPFYQGRITSKKLSNAGIEVIQVVDSAMRWAANNMGTDLMIIGADAVTSEGTVLNKIGSRLLALVAKEEHIPFYIATPLLKYNPDTAFGNYEKIEMRDTVEIWKDWEQKPENIHILNPAFETVNRLYISGVISEAGIFPSGQVHNNFQLVYPFLHEAYHLVEHQDECDDF